MLYIWENLCIARNSIWRRRQKEYYYNSTMRHRRKRTGVYNQLVALERRNFWDVGSLSSWVKELNCILLVLSFVNFVEPLYRRDSYEHSGSESYFWRW